MIYLLYGPLLWALHLFAIYGPQSLFCTRGMAGAVGPTVTAATLVAGLLLLVAIVSPRPVARLLRADRWEESQQGFLDRVMRLLSALSLFGVLAGGATILLLPACGGLR